MTCFSKYLIYLFPSYFLAYICVKKVENLFLYWEVGESEIITTLLVFQEMMIGKTFSTPVQTARVLWSVQSDIILRVK